MEAEFSFDRRQFAAASERNSEGLAVAVNTQFPFTGFIHFTASRAVERPDVDLHAQVAKQCYRSVANRLGLFRIFAGDQRQDEIFTAGQAIGRPVQSAVTIRVLESQVGQQSCRGLRVVVVIGHSTAVEVGGTWEESACPAAQERPAQDRLRDAVAV